ncbi:hypothetical protein RRG08_057681 [Elysia crispata]|uniref:G-protein coupled receptors family 1 profile domain-containing protein n=1 Tax=Elysia crispata TaxID=231223 RepID=A0AAE1AET2_9GAST|nr:hypothetical protein RRG08_057681 [Elysia crispata]
MSMGDSSSEMDHVITSEAPQKQPSYPWLEAVNNFNSYYSIPVVVIVGLAGNLLALTAFLCSPLRRVTTSVYLAGQAFTDLLFLTFLGINWLASIQIDVFALPGLCQTLVYVTYVVSFLSLWLIVALTFDLYSSIKWRCVHRRISRPSRALAIALGLVLTGCGTYAFSFWLTQSIEHGDEQMLCFHNGHRSLAVTGAVIDSALTLVVPFCLLIYMNVRILYVVASLTRRGSGTAGRSHGGRAMRPGSRSLTPGRLKARKLTSSLSGSDWGHGTGRQSRRTSQLILQPSSTADSEVFSRKRVSFEDERRISLVLKEDAIRFDKENGNVIAIAQIVVLDDQVKARTHRVRSSIPMCMPQGEPPRPARSALSGPRESSIDDPMKPYAGYPIRRLSVDVPIQYPSSVQSMSQDERVNKYKASSGVHSESRRKQKSVCSHYPTKKWPTGKAIGVKRESSRYHGRIQQHDSLHRERKQTSSSSRRRRRLPGHKKHSPLTRLQYRCFRMVLSVCLVFLCLNVPSHTIRLQSLIQSLLDPDYRPTPLEFQLQQFLQFIYYLNFVVNVFIYSACAKNFRAACFKIPWHVADTMRQICGGVCHVKKVPPDHGLRKCSQEVARENSRHVEICLRDIHLSEILSPNTKPVSPPCLIPGVPLQSKRKVKRSKMILTPPDASSHNSEDTDCIIPISIN